MGHRPTRSRAHYARTHSRPLEALCLAPWDLLGLDPALGARTCVLARLAKLPRLVAHFTESMDRVERRVVVWARKDLSVFARRAVKLNLLLFTSCHWIGCAWLLCGRLSRRLDDADWVVTWDDVVEVPFKSAVAPPSAPEAYGKYSAEVADATVEYEDNEE